MTKQAYVVQADCVGCELCTQICPAFHIATNGKAEFFATIEVEEAKIQEAINNCPAECIHWKS